MQLFKIDKDFKEELIIQAKSVFGNWRFLFHVALWTYLIWSRVKGVPEAELANAAHIKGLDSYFTARFFVKVFALVGFIYVFLLWIIPYSRYKKRGYIIWMGLFLSVLFWLIITILLNFLLFRFFPAGYELQRLRLAGMHMTDSSYLEFSAGIGYNVGYFSTGMINVLWLFFAYYYYIDLYDQQRSLNRYQKVFADKLDAESVFLKTQINPHFLFNTLNNMYSLALQQSGDASIVAGKLKNLLHYMLYDCAEDRVALAGEVDFIKNYIALEQLRNKQENIDIDIEVKGQMEGKNVAPLLLINFVENAFKHGVKAGIEKAFVKIRIYMLNDNLSMDVINSKPRNTSTAKDMSVKESGGIGVQNVKRRLAILYPKKHKLSIVDSESEYAVHLNIIL